MKMGRRALTQEQFVTKAQAIHGERYDYSETVFRFVDEDVKIICREHGKFWMRAGHHLYLKQGCRHCANQARAKHLSSDIHGRRISEGRAAAKAERDRKQPFGETPTLTALPFWTPA
jgi:hypothetical protein